MAYESTITKTVLSRKTGEATWEVVSGAIPSGGPNDTRNVNTWEPLTGPSISKAGKITYGNISVEAPYDPTDASQTAILSAIQDDTPATDTWEISTSLKTNPGLQFGGVPTSYGLTWPNTGFVNLKFEIGMASDITEGAAVVGATVIASYDPIVADGTTVTYGAAEIKGVENFEISGLTRALVVSASMKDDAPTGGPSNSRKRGNFSFDLLYDDSETVHQTIRTDSKTKNTAKAFVITCTDTGAAAISFSGCISQFDFSGVNTKDGKNRVRVSGYLTTDVTVTP
jgi:hypothetical protein